MPGANQVNANLDAHVRRMEQRAEVAMTKIMADLEAWAKQEHTWQNASGQTESSIKGEVAEASATIVRGILSANYTAGFFLELTRDGKWAWLMPTVLNHQDDILRAFQAVMSS